jgi:1,4-alpha-glucan branching enzyme
VRGAPNKILMRLPRDPRPLRTVVARLSHRTQDKVNAYHRWDAGGPRDDVVVIANFAHRGPFFYKAGLPGGGVWRIRFNSD